LINLCEAYPYLRPVTGCNSATLRRGWGGGEWGRRKVKEPV